MSGQTHAPAALPPGKHTRHLLNMRLAGPHSRSGLFEKSLLPAGIQIPDRVDMTEVISIKAYKTRSQHSVTTPYIRIKLQYIVLNIRLLHHTKHSVSTIKNK